MVVFPSKNVQIVFFPPGRAPARQKVLILFDLFELKGAGLGRSLRFRQNPPDEGRPRQA